MIPPAVKVNCRQRRQRDPSFTGTPRNAADRFRSAVEPADGVPGHCHFVSEDWNLRVTSSI
jgi:hypothetical protein